MRAAKVFLHRDSTNLVFDPQRVMSFDLAGRLLTSYDHGRLYQRGLDHRIVEKWQAGQIGAAGQSGAQSERRRRDLTNGEKERLIADIHDRLAQLVAVLPDADGEVRQRLTQMALWDRAAYALDQDRFRAVYKPVAILPPDQYLSLVLQVTEGCHYNDCLFCEFYRRQPFRIKDQAEFRQHIQAVKGFMGESIRLRRSIFLADANALVIPPRQLTQLFDALNEAFEIAPPALSGSGLDQWKRADGSPRNSTPGGCGACMSAWSRDMNRC